MTRTQCFKRKPSLSTESQQKITDPSLSPSDSLTPDMRIMRIYNLPYHRNQPSGGQELFNKLNHEPLNSNDLDLKSHKEMNSQLPCHLNKFIIMSIKYTTKPKEEPN